MNYYNEYDKGAAQWLRELISTGEIPAGHVDERSIVDVRPSDLAGYVQCHFFAGIGGWSYALKLAGWPGDRPVWTGSCPCQPFSTAGKQRGTEDERHLWPVFHRLIADCRPPVVFGEQVASKLGREWLAGVRSDLEGLAYAVGAADLCAAGVGAPHLRQRLYWVADAGHMLGRGRTQPSVASQHEVADSGLVCDAGQPGLKRTDDNPRVPQRVQYVPTKSGADGDASRLADASGVQCSSCRDHGRGDCEMLGRSAQLGNGCDSGVSDRMEYPEGDGRQQRRAEPNRWGALSRCGSGRMGYADSSTEERLGPERLPMEPEQEAGRSVSPDAWANAELVLCADGKTRRVEPSIFPLAHGVSGRVGLLRGYGNAIVPQVAAEFIGAYLDTLGGVALDSENLL